MNRADIWAAARAASTPGTNIIRVILTMRDAQAFIEIPRTAESALALHAIDGSTHFDRDDYTIEQRDAILVDADAVWKSDHAGAPA